MSNKKRGFVFITLLLALAMCIALNFNVTKIAGENRNAEKFPTPGQDLFGEKLNRFCADRFPARNFLLNQFNTIRTNNLNVNTSQGKVHIGKDGWLFNLEHLFGNERQSTDALIQELLSRQKICDQLGIESLFVIIPHKFKVYPEFVNNNNLFQGFDLADSLVHKAPKDLNILYLRDAMLAQTNGDKRYYKGDHHWTYNGAFVGYNAILENLRIPNLAAKSDFKQINVSKNDLSLWRKRGITNQSEPDEVWFSKRFATSLSEEIQTMTQNWNKEDWKNKPYIINTNNQSARRVLILRDSYTNKLTTFFANDFSEIQLLWDNWKYQFPKEILQKNRPEYFLTIIAEENLYLISNE